VRLGGRGHPAAYIGMEVRAAFSTGLEAMHRGLNSLEVCLLRRAFPDVSPTDRAPLVYVLDDDEALRDSLRWLLESAGYSVVTYSTAERLLLEFESGAAACLVLDVRLPEMSGLDLQRELNRRGETLPIIFVTGHADTRTARDALKNGAFHFLEKPFRDVQLLDLIAQAARQSYGVAASQGHPQAH
jgi:FixJ family two-component response regulator